MNSPQIDIQIIQEWINTQLNANTHMDGTFAMILPIAISRFNMNSDTYWKLAASVCPNITGREQFPFGSPLLWPLIEDFKLTTTGAISFLKDVPSIFKEKAARGFARIWRQQDWKLTKKEYQSLKEFIDIKDLPWISIQPENFDPDTHRVLLDDILELEKRSTQSIYSKKEDAFKWDAGKKKLYESLPIKDWPKIPKTLIDFKIYEYYGQRILQKLKNNTISPEDFEKIAYPLLVKASKPQLSHDIMIELVQKKKYAGLLLKDYYSSNSLFKTYAKEYMQYKDIGLPIILDSRFEPTPPTIALNDYIDDELFDKYIKHFIGTYKGFWSVFDNNPVTEWVGPNVYKINRLRPYILADMYIHIDYVTGVTPKARTALTPISEDQFNKLGNLLGIDVSSKEKIGNLIKETTGINPVILDLCTNKCERMKSVYDLLNHTLTFEPTDLPEDLGMPW